MSIPSRMAAPHEEPAYVAALAAKAAFAQGADQLRADQRVAPVVKSEKIVTAYGALQTTMQQGYDDLQTARRARLDHVLGKVPTGPGVPADATPADATVMNAAFRAALGQVREADPQGRRAMLADALRYGDDTMRRAVLTHAVEANDWPVVSDWADQAALPTLVPEVMQLRDDLQGHGVSGVFERQAFRMPAAPPEVRASGLVGIVR